MRWVKKVKENNFQTLWHHYLEAHPPNQAEVYELKLCKTNRIPLLSVKDHQVEGLKKAQEGLFHKISDGLPIFGGNKHMRFTAKKPFDCLWIQSNAYVCILYYIPRKRKQVVKVDIETYEMIKLIHDKKSISFAEFLKYRESMPITIINLNRKE